MIEFSYKCHGKQTINEFLLKKGYSDSNIYYLLAAKNVRVNGNVVMDKNFFIEEKANVYVALLDEECDIPITDKPLKILYEDKYLLIVDKPYDVDVEPTKANYDDNLACYVHNYYVKNNIKSNIHLVNRLDKITRGIVIIAKNQYIHNLMQKEKITKKYYALVEGNNIKNGKIQINIKKDENSIKRIIDPNGDLCITKYKKIKEIDGNSLLDIEILTGRTHQIRVSMSSINHPILGDSLYGSKSDNKPYLKAYFVMFRHPITNKNIKLVLPYDN